MTEKKIATIKVNNETCHDIETKPLTMLFHGPGVHKLEPLDEDIVQIGPEETILCAMELSQDDWDSVRITPVFGRLWKCVFPDDLPPEKIKNEGMGFKHVIGLIILLVKTINSGKRPYVRFPESYLHPRAQVGLADLFLVLNGGKTLDEEKQKLTGK